MFGAGHLPELLIVLVLALVIFGPKRLPEIGGAMGKGIREFRRGTSGDEHAESPPPAQIPAPADETEATTAAREREVQ